MSSLPTSCFHLVLSPMPHRGNSLRWPSDTCLSDTLDTTAYISLLFHCHHRQIQALDSEASTPNSFPILSLEPPAHSFEISPCISISPSIYKLRKYLHLMPPRSTAVGPKLSRTQRIFRLRPPEILSESQGHSNVAPQHLGYNPVAHPDPRPRDGSSPATCLCSGHFQCPRVPL